MKSQNDALHELSLDRLTLDEYEAFQQHEAIVRANNLRLAITLGIIIMLFLICCMTWYLVAVGTLPWYMAIILNLMLGMIGVIETQQYIKNRI